MHHIGGLCPYWRQMLGQARTLQQGYLPKGNAQYCWPPLYDKLFCKKTLVSVWKAANLNWLVPGGQPYWSFPFGKDSSATAHRLWRRKNEYYTLKPDKGSTRNEDKEVKELRTMPKLKFQNLWSLSVVYTVVFQVAETLGTAFSVQQCIFYSLLLFYRNRTLHAFS